MKNESAESVLSGCLFTIIGIIIAFILRGFIVAKYWEWFIAPYFHTDPITVGAALGISLFIGLFTQSKLTKDEKVADMTVLAGSLYLWLIILGNAILYLAMGYIVHLFVK